MAASANWGAEPLWRIAEQKPATACHQIVVASEPAELGIRSYAYEQLGLGVAPPAQTIPVNPLIADRVAAMRGLRRTPRSGDAALLDRSRLLLRTRPRHVLQTFLRPCELPRASQKQCPAVRVATKVLAIPQDRQDRRLHGVLRLALIARSKWHVFVHQNSAIRREQKGNAEGMPWFCEIRAIAS